MLQISVRSKEMLPQIFLSVMVLVLPLCTGTSAFSQEANWRTPATLADSVCFDPQRFTCTNAKPQFHLLSIYWDKPNIKTRIVVPTAKVRFGPFTLSKIVERRSGTEAVHITSTFVITILARSPALYVNGQYEGANQSFIPIGGTTEVLSGGDHEQKTVYVTATLPSIFTAVKLSAYSEQAQSSMASDFPADCGDLPDSAEHPETLDQPCLQVAVNPLAVLMPKVAPLAIIYEPPGNCSWANLTQTHAVGSDMTVQDATSTSTRTISDFTVLSATVDHHDFTEEKVSAKERESKVIVSQSGSLGTLLGLPLGNPGNPECNNPNVIVPPRQSSGPGQGDLFILLYEPSLIYWDTADMSNSVFTDSSAPGHPRHVFTAFASQIAAGQGLPPGISLTQEERNAILGLDLFTVPNWSPTNLPERFVSLGEISSLSQGTAYEQNETQQRITAGRIKEAVTNAQAGSTDNLDIAQKLTLKAFSYGGAAALNAVVGVVLEWMASQWPNPSAMGFDDVEKAVKEKGVTELFNYSNQTTITTTFTRNKEIDKTNDNTITQNFYIKDTNQGLNVALFYDALFGTFAFLPWPDGMGVASNYTIRQLPSFVWSVVVKRGKPVIEKMPPDLTANLTKVPASRVLLAPLAQYAVSNEFTKGLPSGLQLDLSRGTLRGQIGVGKEKARALFFVLDSRGKKVAQLWVTIDVS